jgi:signal transduction histidine kinase
MTTKTITVGIAEDAIEQIAKVSLDKAIEELIWNALDAEATKVKVSFQLNSMDGIEKVIVSDNGHGLPYEDGRCEGQPGFSSFVGVSEDLLRNIHGVAPVAELDGDEMGYLLGKVAEIKRQG